MLPEVGSITTLFPGMSLPSFSAASTMALAILSLTDPPADVYSTLPTVENDELEEASNHRSEHTKIAFEAIVFGDTVESDEWCVSDCAECIVQNLR